MIRQALAELDSLEPEELIEARQRMAVQSGQVPVEIKPVFEYLLQKLEERIEKLEETWRRWWCSIEKGESEDVFEEVESEEQPGVLELNPQQLATANEFLANFEGKELGDLVQINAALQAAITAVPEDERIILEYVLQKLSVYIAELEQ